MKPCIKVCHVQEDPHYLEYDEKRFEEIFGVRYLKHLEFADWDVEQSVKKHCARADRRKKIGHLGQWLGVLHAKAIEDGKVPDVTIRWMHEKIGYGVFTNRPFKKWEFLGEYTGLLRRRNILFRNINDYCFMYPREGIRLKAFTIDSKKHGNFTRFINHSDTPNAESVSVYHGGIFHIIFRTIKDIPANTEITYDYGDIYWFRRKKLDDDQSFS